MPLKNRPMLLKQIERLTKPIHCSNKAGAFDLPIVSEDTRRVAVDQVRNVVCVVRQRKSKLGVLSRPDAEKGVAKNLKEGVSHIVWHLSLSHRA